MKHSVAFSLPNNTYDLALKLKYSTNNNTSKVFYSKLFTGGITEHSRTSD